LSKERLSKLQKWILKKCYGKGKDHYATPDYFIGRITLVVWRIREYLETKEIKEYFDGLVKIGRYTNEKERLDWFRSKFEVSTTNSLKNLARKGYIDLLGTQRIRIRPDSRYHWATKDVQLTDKGIKAVKESLKIKKRKVNNKRQ